MRGTKDQGRGVGDLVLLLRPAGGADVTFRPRPALPSLDTALCMDTPGTWHNKKGESLLKDSQKSRSVCSID